MSYEKTDWKDRVVEHPRRFTDQNSNVLTLTPSPGTVTESGTDFSATNMNKIEDGIYKAAVAGAVYIYTNLKGGL